MDYLREYVARVGSFSRSAKLVLWSSALNSLALSVTSVDLNLYFVRVGLSEGLLGSLVSYSAFAGVLLALPAGRISDRFGRRAALLASGSLAVAGTLAQVVRPLPVVLVPATFVTGAALMVTAVTWGPLLVETSASEERAHLFGFQAATVLGASVVGANLGGFLPKFLAGLLAVGADTVPPLRATLLVGAGFNLLALVPLLSMKEERRDPAPAGAARSTSAWLNLSAPRLVGRIVLTQLLVGLGAGLFLPLQNVFMDRYLGASPAQIGFIFSAASALTGLASLVAPLLARWGKVRAIAASQFLSLPFLAVMGLVPSLWVYGAASLLRSAFMNLANPLVSNFCMEVVESRERATVNSLLYMSWNLGGAVCGWAGGWLMQNVSYILPYLVAWPLYAVSTTLFYRYFRAYDPALPLRPAPARTTVGGRGETGRA